VPERRFNWKRPAAEFIAIFAGVTLSLFADDYRDSRADRSRERAGLQLILTDLEADTSEIRTVARFSGLRDRAAARFLRLVETPSQPDSVGLVLRQFIRGAGHSFQSSGFVSLRDADRLSLITNDTLRSALVEYFDEGQVELDQSVAMEQDRRDRLLAAMAKHVRWPRPRTSESTWPFEDGPVVLTSSWDAARSDGEFIWTVQDLGSLSQNAHAAAERLMVRNGELRAAIRRELGY